MDTPKRITQWIDDVEAAQADIRSGDPRLAMHGLSMMISVLTEQASHLSDNYPEQRRMAAFVANHVRDMKAAFDVAARLAEEQQEQARRREQALADYREREALRKHEEKAQRAEQRKLAAERRARSLEAKLLDQEQRAVEEARQGKLFE